MDRFIARANVDHYLDLLDGGKLAPSTHAMVIKLLIAEEDRLGHDLENLEFAEARLARCRKATDDLKRKIGEIDGGAPERAIMEQLAIQFEVRQKLMADFCYHLRAKVQSRF